MGLSFAQIYERLQLVLQCLSDNIQIGGETWRKEQNSKRLFKQDLIRIDIQSQTRSPTIWNPGVTGSRYQPISGLWASGLCRWSRPADLSPPSAWRNGEQDQGTEIQTLSPEKLGCVLGHPGHREGKGGGGWSPVFLLGCSQIGRCMHLMLHDDRPPLRASRPESVCGWPCFAEETLVLFVFPSYSARSETFYHGVSGFWPLTWLRHSPGRMNPLTVFP